MMKLILAIPRILRNSHLLLVILSFLMSLLPKQKSIFMRSKSIFWIWRPIPKMKMHFILSIEPSIASKASLGLQDWRKYPILLIK